MDVFRNMLYMARRFKTATVLNFIGLTVAFAACYLFLTQGFIAWKCLRCLTTASGSRM